MKVTIHIGTYKTATSAIQFSLARSPKQLGRVGAKYAESGLNKALSKHLHLYDTVIDTPANHGRHEGHRDKNYLAGLLAELQEPGVKHLLVSEEELSFPSPAVAEYFAPLAEVAEVQVVMVVRNQPELMESIYLQFLKEPPRRLSGTFAEFLETPEAVERGDFTSILAPWARAFGTSAIQVIDFEDLKREGPIEGFAKRLGLPGGLQQPDRLINPSIDPAAGELLRRIGSVYPSYPRMQLAVLTRSIEKDESYSLLTPELVAGIRARHRVSNEELAASYGVDIDCDPTPSGIPIDQNDLVEPALDVAVHAMFARWQQRQRAIEKLRVLAEEQADNPEVREAVESIRQDLLGRRDG